MYGKNSKDSTTEQYLRQVSPGTVRVEIDVGRVLQALNRPLSGTRGRGMFGSLPPGFVEQLPAFAQRLLMLQRFLVGEAAWGDLKLLCRQLDVCRRTPYGMIERIEKHAGYRKSCRSMGDLLGACGWRVQDGEAAHVYLNALLEWAWSIGQGMAPPSVTVLGLVGWLHQVVPGRCIPTRYPLLGHPGLWGEYWLEMERAGVVVGHFDCQNFEASGEEVPGPWNIHQRADGSWGVHRVWLLSGFVPIDERSELRALAVEEAFRERLLEVVVDYPAFARDEEGRVTISAITVSVRTCSCGRCERGTVGSLWGMSVVPEAVPEGQRQRGVLVTWFPGTRWEPYGIVQTETGPGKNSYHVVESALSDALRAELRKATTAAKGEWALDLLIPVSFESSRENELGVAAVKLAWEPDGLAPEKYDLADSSGKEVKR